MRRWVAATDYLDPSGRRAGGCSHPIQLVGRTDTLDLLTGELVASFGSEDMPAGRLLVACGDRRVARCPACSAIYRRDTYQLVRAGLAGGKGVPDTVAGHPCLFLTLTPPGFGPVHTRRVGAGGRELRCRPRRDGGSCDHGRPVACTMVHGEDDPALGQPICSDCYDYPGAVLWQAHAGRLWNRFTLATRRHLATTAGLGVRKLGEEARVSFVRVAEFQRRGLVHLHAVVRLDGPGGPADPPPEWGTVELLADAVRSAHAAVLVRTPYTAAVGELDLTWGPRLNVQTITAAVNGAGGDRARVAAYIAKYVTKSAETAGIRASRMHSLADLDRTRVSPHARRMARTCWQLGGLPEYRHLRLRAWAHVLGYRGHASSKSRYYSTTLGALRDARAEHVAPRQPGTVRERQWAYAGRGYPPAGRP